MSVPSGNGTCIVVVHVVVHTDDEDDEDEDEDDEDEDEDDVEYEEEDVDDDEDDEDDEEEDVDDDEEDVDENRMSFGLILHADHSSYDFSDPWLLRVLSLSVIVGS